MGNESSSTVKKPCQFCGTHHYSMCPKIKAIDYFEDGTIKRLEFYDMPSATIVAGPWKGSGPKSA